MSYVAEPNETASTFFARIWLDNDEGLHNEYRNAARAALKTATLWGFSPTGEINRVADAIKEVYSDHLDEMIETIVPYGPAHMLAGVVQAHVEDVDFKPIAEVYMYDMSTEAEEWRRRWVEGGRQKKAELAEHYHQDR